MKLKLLLVTGVVFAGSQAYADTLNTTGFAASTGTFSALSLGSRGVPGGADGSPFFYNDSVDMVNGSHAASAGDFLADIGAFALNGNVTPNCSGCGVNYTLGGLQMYTQGTDAASAFSFIRQATALTITLLYANSSTNNNAEFGLYDATDQTSALYNHAIIQQGAAADLNDIIGTTYNVTNPYATWGIYARVCNANAPTGACPGANIQTLFSDVALNSVNGDTPAADANHMHWALFQSGTNAAVYYMALEDGVFTGVRDS